MEDDIVPLGKKPPAVDWAGLRAQAEKLGISLSELQQRQREKQARLDKRLASKLAPDLPKE